MIPKHKELDEDCNNQNHAKNQKLKSSTSTVTPTTLVPPTSNIKHDKRDPVKILIEEGELIVSTLSINNTELLDTWNILKDQKVDSGHFVFRNLGKSNGKRIGTMRGAKELLRSAGQIGEFIKCCEEDVDDIRIFANKTLIGASNYNGNQNSHHDFFTEDSRGVLTLRQNPNGGTGKKMIFKVSF